MHYANFANSRLKVVQFTENDLAESFFTTCVFMAVDLIKNHLDKANFWETSLTALDFSTNKFEHLKITPALAKNIKISLEQAPFFASLFGIEII